MFSNVNRRVPVPDDRRSMSVQTCAVPSSSPFGSRRTEIRAGAALFAFAAVPFGRTMGTVFDRVNTIAAATGARARRHPGGHGDGAYTEE